MSVPLQDPAREYHALRAEIDEELREVASGGRYVLGPRVEAFESAMAEYLGIGWTVGVASGTDALVLALRALGVGEGDEVILPPFSFFATAEAVLRTGAVPVFADIRPGTFNLDPAAAGAAVTRSTAAVLAVHLFGQMADVGGLREVADRHGLALVEDVAQAAGAARRDGRGWVRAGTAGAVGCFSFYPTKNLGGMGDGGLVVTDDPGLAARVRRLRDHGRDPDREGRHREVGYNSRLDALQAAVLAAKLPRLDEWNGRRRRNARAYDDVLADLSGLAAPRVAPGSRHVYHQYTLRCPEDRDRFRAHLEERGIGHGIYYPRPLHRTEPLREAHGGEGRFPGAERAAREVVSLPVFPLLRDEERAEVVDALRAYDG